MPESFGHNTFCAELHDIEPVLDALVARAARRCAARRASALVRPFPGRRHGHSLRRAAIRRIQALVTWAAISNVDRWPGRSGVARAGKMDIVNTRTGQVLPLYTDVLDDVERHGRTTLDIRGAAARIRDPWLILHGGADPDGPGGRGRGARAASGCRLTRLLIIPGAGPHLRRGASLRGHDAPLAEALDETVKWFGQESL